MHPVVCSAAHPPGSAGRPCRQSSLAADVRARILSPTNPRNLVARKPRNISNTDGRTFGALIFRGLGVFFFRVRELPTRSRVYKNPRFRRTGDYLCARGDLNPHPLIRGLAPQASASAYSATRAGDFRTFSLRCRSKQHVILYGLSGISANQESMLCITLLCGGFASDRGRAHP